MHCFNHRQHHAIGLCKNCGKALCEECYVLVDGAVACKNACEEKVTILNYIVDRGYRAYKGMGSQWIPAVLINGVCGLLFLGFGIYTFKNGPWSWFMIGLGTVMMIGGVVSVANSLRMRDKKTVNKSASITSRRYWTGKLYILKFMQRLVLLVLSAILLIIVVWLLMNSDVDTLVIAPDAVLPDGGKYYGDLADGKFHGKGRLIWENGARFEGEFSNGLISGNGEVVSGTGDKYTGEFANGLENGVGRSELVNGDVYEGEYRNGMFDGHGILTTKDGRIYEGEYVKSQLVSGIYKDKLGNVYEGDFKDWQFHGQGVYKTSEGETYKGAFVDGQFSGRGEFEDSDGDVSTGEFASWLLNGKGTRKSKDGAVYEGEFANGFFHGKGVLIDKDKNKYTGEFQYGYKEGKGKLEYAEPKDGATVLRGKWKYDRYVDPNENAKQAKRNEALENALYSQNALLDSALGEVLPGEPGKIELYFLGVAGYGKQNVFNNEVSFIKKLFDDNYDTEGHSLTLVNNDETIGRAPFATATSLEKALNSITAKMNEEDILFLYITSHGSDKFEISIQQNGLSLPDLTAAKLKEIVDKLPIKWKVIAISACYSGGFVPVLKNDNTLIMTAASSTRKSFGCSDTSEMTYFGRAYFKESLLNSTSFQNAFDNAVMLIRQWEQDEIEKNKDAQHSDPQISVGANIVTQLQAYWNQRTPPDTQ